MPLSKFFHRRSLTLATMTLLLSLFAASHVLGFTVHLAPPSPAFAVRTVALFVVACVVCFHATVNLVRDVDRGYSPDRCSLAAVILLGAFLLLFFLGFGLASFITRE